MYRVTVLVVSVLVTAEATGVFAAGEAPQAGAAAGQASAPARPEIAISKSVEEGKEMLVAKVTLDGKALEGAKVAFFVERTFGLLALGAEETLDDGTAAVPFPVGLPGGATGELRIIAEIKGPAQYASARGQATVGGGVVKAAEVEPFPRTVWGPRAPVPLILTIAVLVGGVWCTYAFVVVQLVNIRKGAKR